MRYKYTWICLQFVGTLSGNLARTFLYLVNKAVVYDSTAYFLKELVKCLHLTYTNCKPGNTGEVVKKKTRKRPSSLSRNCRAMNTNHCSADPPTFRDLANLHRKRARFHVLYNRSRPSTWLGIRVETPEESLSHQITTCFQTVVAQRFQPPGTYITVNKQNLGSVNGSFPWTSI